MTALLAAACLNGCGEKHRDTDRQAISYAARAPGSDVMPTNETSFRLIADDGPTRLGTLRGLIVQSGNRCDFVSRGILVGGLDGTDEWRVTCAGTGTWTVLLRPAGVIDVRNCSNADCGGSVGEGTL
jgi:hypothetical protein